MTISTKTRYNVFFYCVLILIYRYVHHRFTVENEIFFNQSFLKKNKDYMSKENICVTGLTL